MISTDLFGPDMLISYRGNVLPEWIDFNGHVNVGYYIVAFNLGSLGFLDAVGLGRTYPARRGGSTFALEMHATYDREIHVHEPFELHTRVLDCDAKRIHMYHEMRHADEGWLAATNEIITMHINMETRRSAPFPDDIFKTLDAIRLAQVNLPMPSGVGRTIGIRRA
ncbi:thioesterase family protein [uncultured Thalassospira sp.]|jgi:acyl-CoA thioester hydrolase|uniref:thioesterase family protein n=1 Tax=uncultured Thalassospira sp. TaxID=404382 RepID=UPI0030DCEAA1|tara:strand:- start:5812 stop:6309 length:498 start_codon:yes stop_codon:yes gene_type:complete